MFFFAKKTALSATQGILQEADPRKWREHLFGLPEERWSVLAGKSFWITGAGTGYGRSMSVALAAAGAQVFLTGRRLTQLESTLTEARSYGIDTSTCHTFPTDITDTIQVEKTSNEIRKRCTALYGLVNNAALPPPPHRYPLMDMTLDEWNRLLSTNVTGQWLVCRAILPHMVKGGSFRVLFVTSEAGWAFTPGIGAYNVTKAAINNLGGSFAAECADRYPNCDAQVNVLVPGEANTEMNQGSKESPYSVVSMALTLLSHPSTGPNGKFFHRDGRHLAFGYASPYEDTLL